MSIENVTQIHLGIGNLVRPQWPAGTASENWYEAEYRSFTNQSGSLFGGSWIGEPGELVLESYPYNEICVMVFGHVALVDAQGGRKDFRGGDSFFVPKGFSGLWLTLQPSTKIFIAVEND
ncbi:cupin domain-containing protein [Pseudomonas chlororaphis]|uniref:cupin domain-containing protein n=1 Tax=Pseudomonas chlororaphis TaxID=587753 RepID=UPI00046F85BB|nr:cupin domain-containing protein [Pseudomonas chlororaphis]